MFEGTGKYFLFIFLIFVIVYIVKKICFYTLFKTAKIKQSSALIPIYTTYVLVEELNMKKSIFYLCLIPGINLFYYHKIYQQLLQGFGQNPKEAIWFVLIPMYKFPELVFKKPRFILNEYDLTKDFIENQNDLFMSDSNDLPDKIELVNLSNKIDEYNGKENNDIVIQQVKYEQMPRQNIDNSVNINNQSIDLANNTEAYQENTVWTNSKQDDTPIKQNINVVNNVSDNSAHGDSVFTNESLQPDERHEKIVIAEKKVEEEKKPIDPYSDGRPQMCPNCGARLSAGATTCFLCGTKLK